MDSLASSLEEEKNTLGSFSQAVIIVIAAVGVSAFMSSPQKTSSSLTQKCTVNAYGSIGLTVINSSSGTGVPGLSIGVREYSPICATVASAPYFDLGSMTTDSNDTIMTDWLIYPPSNPLSVFSSLNQPLVLALEHLF